MSENESSGKFFVTFSLGYSAGFSTNQRIQRSQTNKDKSCSPSFDLCLFKIVVLWSVQLQVIENGSPRLMFFRIFLQLGTAVAKPAAKKCGHSGWKNGSKLTKTRWQTLVGGRFKFRARRKEILPPGHLASQIPFSSQGL